RVAWWVEHLLADKRWSDYFRQRIARACVGTHEGPFLLFRRRKFNTWLSEQLEQGTPYDRIVRQMISSDGLWTDTPAVNFVTATMDEGNNGRADPIRLAGRTCRAFLAMRIDCLQCHDDVLQRTNFGNLQAPREGTQEDFHGLAAFYAGTATADPVFRGIIEDQRAYSYQFLNEESERTVSPQVPFYRELLPSNGKPRERLGAWVTHPENKMFARATVNRMWALMFGRALVEPVDDIPLVGDLPPMLDVLADDFVKHQYNLRRLVALIANSAAFQRSSRAEFEISPAHEAAWAVFPLTQLRPDQVATSIIQTCRLTAIDTHSSIFLQLQAFGDGQEFVKSFGDRGEDEFNADPITITQRLLMMNGNMVSERTKIDLVANASTRIARFVKNDDEALDLIYLTILNRYPTHDEQVVFKEHLQGKYGRTRARAMSDMAWAMLNTTEFCWNH
ncbi:MAG: DUF1553 domain-containing protein, partial [Pirellulaceae bacterium]|nr:DUF1553 domain-containing protein [Pirellulaceae bacterium]